TVSMGLGPIMSIYQAHIQKYLMNRGLIKEEDRKVWAYLGDGEMDCIDGSGSDYVDLPGTHSKVFNEPRLDQGRRS
ncbi:hypothetical protein EKL28_18785, partial [Staphylococcus aureus]